MPYFLRYTLKFIIQEKSFQKLFLRPQKVHFRTMHINLAKNNEAKQS